MSTKLGLMGKTDCSARFITVSCLYSSSWIQLHLVAPLWCGFISPVVTNLCYSRSHHITHMWLMAQCVLMCGVGGLMCAGACIGCVVCLVCACSDASGEMKSGFLTHGIDWYWGASVQRRENKNCPLCFRETGIALPLTLHPHYNTWERERGMLYKANFWSVANNLQAERKE